MKFLRVTSLVVQPRAALLRGGLSRARARSSCAPISHALLSSLATGVVRTPDERFRDLPAWPFAPRFADVPRGEGKSEGETLRVHYVDEGSGASGETIVCLHGQPT